MKQRSGHTMAAVVPQRECDEERLRALGKRLLDQECAFAKRYRCLFALMNVKPNELTRQPLVACLQDQKHGALLRHEVAYVLGQMQDEAEEVVGELIRVVGDETDDVMVRHEAAEALGAIGSDEGVSVLRQHLKDDTREVAETCELALRRIEDAAASRDGDVPEHEGSQFNTVDPTLVSEGVSGKTREELERLALDETASMHDRYEAIFAARNRGGEEAVSLMSKCLETAKSALLKHEVAFVLGQLQNAQATEVLVRVLKDPAEHPMVRHEAAEALGSVAESDDQVMGLLREYCKDEVQCVGQSCVVALDMLETKENFEYCEALA